MEINAVKKLIKKHTPGHSSFVLEAMEAERYYRNKSDILYKEKRKTEEPESSHPVRNADNRIPRNFHGLIVNQKASYAFTYPPLFDVGKKSANKRIAEVLGDEYAKNCMELCINAANTKIGWIHYWEGEDGFEWAVLDSKQVIPVWGKSLKKKLCGVLRVYEETDEDTGDTYTIYQYWNDETCEAYRLNNGFSVEDGLIYYNMFTDPETGEELPEQHHGYGEVPFIPFFNNNIHTNDLENIKPLIDVYDKVYSGFINDLDDIQELILILTGYGGTDLNEFLSDLKKFKVIKMDADESGSGVSTLNMEIPIEARQAVLEATRKAIFEQGQGFDPQPENFGNQSGEALKFMYSLLEMKTGLMETEFRLGFSRLVRAICKYENLECKHIDQTWTRTCIKNDTEQAQICRDSVDIVSLKTILKNHPLVEDVEEELAQLEKEAKEKQEKEDIYAGSFKGKSQDGETGDVDAGQGEEQ